MAENPNTNAIAYQQLRPLANTNLGGILEEHTRYWKKYKDEEEAEELARKAAQARGKAESNAKENKFVLDNLGLDDSQSYFRDQIVSDYNRMKPEMTRLARLAFRGDDNALLKLDDMKQNLKEMVTLDNTSGKALSTLIASEDKRNKWIDNDKSAFAENIIGSKYRIENGSIIFLDEDGKDTSKFSAQQMRDKLNSLGTYSGKAKFKEYSDDIATKLLDVDDGAKEIDAQTKVDGIKSINTVFASDKVELRSFYNYATKTKDVDGNPLFDPSQPLRDLDKTQLNQLAGLYYDEFTEPKVRQIKNGLDRAKKNADLEAKNRSNLKAKKEQDLVIIPAVNSDGTVLIPDATAEEQTKAQELVENGGRAIAMSNATWNTADSNTSDGTNRELMAVSVDDDGKLTALLKKVEVQPIYEKPKVNDLVIGAEYPISIDKKTRILTLVEVNGDNLTFGDTDKKGNVTNIKKGEAKYLQEFNTGKTRKVITTEITDKPEDFVEIALKTIRGTPEDLKNLIIEKTKNLKTKTDQPTTSTINKKIIPDF